MSFFANFTKSLISSFRYANLTNQITVKFLDIVRGESTGSSACVPPSRSSLKKLVSYGRKDCVKPRPVCGIEVMAMAKCRPRRKFSEDWHKCCKELCKWAHPRFDDLYYKPSDKENRKYQQTWAECSEIFIHPKGICCYTNYKYPQPEKRKPAKQIAYCEELRHCKLTMLCRNRLGVKCAKLLWPGCRGARDPPKCELKKRKHCGKRPTTPYPSFSECCQDTRPLLREVECKCLKVPLGCYPV